MATMVQNHDLGQEAEAALRARLDPARFPRHVAVIMDGNGRWARRRGLPRIEGHRAGIKSVREIVTTCRELEIPYLTLYAFSVENWKRPAAEISALMLLLRNYLWREKKTLLDNGIRLNTIGRIRDLPETVHRSLAKVIDATAGGDHMTLSVALSYGGRADLLDAVNALVAEARAGTLPPARSARRLSPPASPRAACLIPISWCAPAANSASPTSSCGKSPTPSFSSRPCSGRTSAAAISTRRCWITSPASAASAASRPCRVRKLYFTCPPLSPTLAANCQRE